MALIEQWNALIPVIIAFIAVGAVVWWNYSITFKHDILGFYRIGTVLPHSPYLTPSADIVHSGEVGYDGQLFLTMALDPMLQHPASLAALDNPRYRARRICFPALGYALSFSQRHCIPYMLVFLNGAFLIALVGIAGGICKQYNGPALYGLLVLCIPGYWEALLLTTSDLLASLLLGLAIMAYIKDRYKAVAVLYALAALTHETMLIVIGSLALPLFFRHKWRAGLTVLAGAIPVCAWNLYILWRVPSGGSSTGILENFTLPGAGLIDKVIHMTTASVSIKWVFDSTSFLLLCAVFCLFIFKPRKSDPPLSVAVQSCAWAYLCFFAISKMQILSYYVDFLRVYANVIFLAILLLPLKPRRRWMMGILLTWGLFTLAFIAAYSSGLI